MKELMVTLLLLTWTGMVVAQQNDDNAFRGQRGASDGSFGGSGTKAPIVPIVSGDESGKIGGDSSQGSGYESAVRARNAFPTQKRTREPSSTSTLLDSQRPARESFPSRVIEASNPFSSQRKELTGQAPRQSSTSNPTPRRDQGRAPRQPIAYLGLPAKAISELQEYGSVEAPVDSRFVDRITISDRDVPKQGPAKQVTPTLRGDTLVFQFNRQQLADISEFSYEFEIPAYLKGKYTSATIEYPPTLDRLAANSSGSNTSRGSGFQSDDSRWRLAGDTSQRDPIRVDNQRDPIQVTNQRNLLGGDSNRLSDRDIEYQRELERQRLARDQWQRDKEAAEKLELEQKARYFENELARMRSQQPVGSRMPVGSQQPVGSRMPVGSQIQPGLYPPVRVADNSYLPGQVTTPPPVVPPTNYSTYPSSYIGTAYQQPATQNSAVVLQMQNQMRQMQERVAQLNNQNQYLENEIRNVSNRGGYENPDSYNYNRDARFDNRSDLARNASSTGRNRSRAEADPPNLNRNTVMSVGGDPGLTDDKYSNSGFDEQKKPNRERGARSGEYMLLTLMLLCSIGLNIYLWFLSRTFYSRYQELADELRDTFTATV